MNTNLVPRSIDTVFELVIFVDQILSCPPSLDYRGDVFNFGLLDSKLFLQFRDEQIPFYWDIDMTFEEQLEWLTTHISHDVIYELIADEYDVDVQDFVECQSCIDFHLIDFSKV